LRTCTKALLILTVLCAPININDNVITVIGNATSPKNVFSLCSFYQQAGEDAVTTFGLTGYQEVEGRVKTFAFFSKLSASHN